MRPGAKMLLMAERGSDSRRGDRYGRNEYDADARYSMQNNYDEVENRSRYKRDSRGRFRSEGGDMEMYGAESRNGKYADMGGYPSYPVYERNGQMNQIGFARGDEVATNYRMNATHKGGSEMEYRPSSYMSGRASSSGGQMTKEMAEEWTRSMKNEDGTKGPHWKMEQVKQLMAQKGLQYDPWEFFAVLNAVYSDYCSVFKKHGVNTIDMYVDLATAWLNDSDAVDDKASLYYECIVKK